MQDGPDDEATPHPVTGAARSLRTQQRAYEPDSPHHPRSTRPRRDAVLAAMTMPAELVSVPPSSTASNTPRPPGSGRPSRSEHRSGPPSRGERPVLLRKEVIQPHLPVRLPCYDFVPIADPAFDGSLHKGWATGFGRYRLS